MGLGVVEALERDAARTPGRLARPFRSAKLVTQIKSPAQQENGDAWIPEWKNSTWFIGRFNMKRLIAGVSFS
jgi:hypothetical protein